MNSKKHLLVGNWKMKLTAEKARTLAQALAKLSETLKNSEIWVAPSFTAIPDTAAVVRSSLVKLGAQNVYGAAEGAFTGEISVPMLREFGCEFSIVGHSERRIIFGESADLVAQRAAPVLKQGFTLIFCVGETGDDRKRGVTNSVLQSQMAPLLEAISDKEAAPLVIAYEPVWAIGTGVVAKVEEIADAHQTVARIWNSKFPGSCPAILYGGSVAPNNFREILQVPLVAGALIGGASLTFESMQALAKIAEETHCKP